MTNSDNTRHDVEEHPADTGHRPRELHLVPTHAPDLVAELRAVIADREREYQALEGAIASARRIGAAIGIVMTIMKVTEPDAFAMLARISQRQNRKLRLVADDIVLTGDF